MTNLAQTLVLRLVSTLWTVIDMARIERRQFLGGLLAAGLIPKPTWADVGSPVFLSAAATSNGSYVLCGIDAALQVRFQIPLPTRGHAAAAHPSRPEAVAFARRPGTFAIVIDCITGDEKARIESPMDRHFYGHGIFSSDGNLLFTTENDYEAGRGRIGVWDAQNGYTRIDEWDSGGVGPHDIKRLPGTDMLVVANGGIDTHPDTGRTKLNIPTMAPNLAYIEDGTVAEIASLPADMHKNSIRHLAVGADGQVAFGMQWQGGDPIETLVGIHQMGRPFRLMTASTNDVRDMQGYVGSIALSSNGQTIAVTSPRGGIVQEYDIRDGELSRTSAIPDVCGVAVFGQNITVSAGTGEMRLLNAASPSLINRTRVQWDNHLIPISVALT